MYVACALNNTFQEIIFSLKITNNSATLRCFCCHCVICVFLPGKYNNIPHTTCIYTCHLNVLLKVLPSILIAALANLKTLIVSLKILKLFTDVRFVCVSGLDANDGYPVSDLSHDVH